MKRLKTLRARFALGTAGLVLCVLSAFGVYVYGSMARGLSAAIDDSLALVASQVIAGLDIAHDRLVFFDNFVDEPENADLRARGFTVRVLTPEGQTLQEFGLYRAWQVWPESTASAPYFTTLSDATDQHPLRVYTVPVPGEDQPIAIVQVAQSLAGVQETLRRLLTTLLVSGPLLVIIAGFSGYCLAARALAPIDQIIRTARRIAAGDADLSTRLNLPPTADEVGRLGQTLDAMLARLDDSFRRERQFTADASHELRTPLTAIQAILGMIRRKRRTPEEYERALTKLAEETGRLQSLAENLLQLARRETPAGNLASPKRIDLSTLVRDVTDSFRPLAEAKALTLTCDVPDHLSVVGDQDDLLRLLANLLDNAIKYTERGTITLEAKRIDDFRLLIADWKNQQSTISNRQSAILISVSDTGPGIPAEHLPYLFDRFYRVDKSRTTPGAGLGLAIALEIARAHGGRLEVSSVVGEGTCFTLTLPCSM